jgi:hypothetical protein
LDHSRQQVNGNWTSRRKGVLVLTATLVYAVTFVPFHRVLGHEVTALSILPVVAAGWYYGLQVGLLAGLLTFPLNTLLLNLAGEPGWGVLILTGGIPTYAVAVLIGTIVGHLHNLGEQMKQEHLLHTEPGRNPGPDHRADHPDYGRRWLRYFKLGAGERHRCCLG